MSKVIIWKASTRWDIQGWKHQKLLPPRKFPLGSPSPRSWEVSVSPPGEFGVHLPAQSLTLFGCRGGSQSPLFGCRGDPPAQSPLFGYKGEPHGTEGGSLKGTPRRDAP